MHSPSNQWSRGTYQANSKNRVSRRRYLVLAAASSFLGVQSIHAAQTWDASGAGAFGGGTGTWDTTSPLWDTGATAPSAVAVWANTSTSDAIFEGTAGTVTVAAGGVNLELAKINTSGYVLTGGNLNMSGATAGFTEAASVTTQINNTLVGSAGVKFTGGSFSTSLFNLSSGANTYSGLSQISVATVTFSVLANNSVASSFGVGGMGSLANFNVGGGSSTVKMAYNGSGGSTDRPLVDVGTGFADIFNNGTGPIAFTNTSTGAMGGVVGVRNIQFGGSAPVTAVNTFSQSIADLGTGTSITGVSFSGTTTWALAGVSTYTGATGFLAGPAQADAAETPGTSGPFGKSGPMNFSGGSLQYSALDNADYSARIAIGTSTKAVAIDTNGVNVTFATALTALQNGGLTKIGAGTLILNAANAYTGVTNFTNGVLQADAADTAGTSGPFGASTGATGALNFSGGTLQYSSLNNTDYSSRIAAGTSSKAVSIDTNGVNVTFATALTSGQSNGLTKLGLGTLTLPVAEAYAGNTNIGGGTLAITNASALPSTSVVYFSNTTGPATLDITGLNQTVAGLVFGTQTNTSTNTVTIQGNAATSLTTAQATLNFVPYNSSGNLVVDMSSLGTFTYNNQSGNFNVSMGANANPGGGSALVKLAATNDFITANNLFVGRTGTPTLGTGSQSTLILGTNATLDATTIGIGVSGSRGGGTVTAGSGLLTIAGATGGSSTAALNIGNNDSNSVPLDVISSVLDTSAGTLAAQLGAVTIAQTTVNVYNASRGVMINAGLTMGAGTLSATSLTIGLLNSGTGVAGSSYYQQVVNGSFNMTGGTATVPTITLGSSQFVGNFNSTTGLTSSVSGLVTLNSGATLNATTIAQGTIVTPAQGTVAVNSTINWNDGTINNIAGADLALTGLTVNLAGATANHALTISSGQTANVASVINGSSGALTLNGAGTVKFLGSNTYAGPTLITNGTLIAGALNSLSPNSAINISTGTLDASGFANTVAGLTEGTGGILDIGYGNLLNVTGTVNLTGVLNIFGTGTAPENLINYSSGSVVTFSNTPTNIPAGDMLLVTPTALKLVAISTGPSTLNWTNASTDKLWNTSSLNFNTATGTTVAYSDTSNSSLSAGDIVSFTDNNNGNYAVTIPALVHPTSTTVNNSGGTYTFNGSGGIAGPGGLLKQGTGALSLYVSNSYTGGTNISAGTVSLYNTHALPAFGSLSIGSTAKLTATTLGNAYAVQIGSLTLTPGGTVDLVNNAATIRGSTISGVFKLVQSGFNGSTGAWTGTGITSSAAASSHLNALGVIINDTGANNGTSTGTPLYTTSSSTSTIDGDILVKYTYFGDANLDGKVDGSDYSLIDSNFVLGGTLTGWYNGDFNYDGVINGSDYTLIDNAFNTQGAQISAVVASPTAEITGSSAVPEPTTLSLLCLGTAGLLGRRRRQI